MLRYAGRLAHASGIGHRSGRSAAAAPSLYVGARAAVCQALACAAALNVCRTQPHLAIGMGQMFSTAAAAQASSEKRKLFVQVAGQDDLAKLVTEAADVADLKKDIIKELPSLAKVDPSIVSLHLADIDDAGKPKNVRDEALPAHKTLDKANVGDGACIVVKVAGAAATASPADIAALARADITAEDALKLYSKPWRDAAENLSKLRKQLADVPMLHLKSATLDSAAAKDFKVTLLHPAKPTAGKAVELGVFTLPKLETSITAGPKGFKLDDLTSFFVDQQRLQLTMQHIAAVAAAQTSLSVQKHGVLLSGPNGVGKSGVGIETFLTCLAQGLFVVYIASTRDWVEAAKRGEGEIFFLKLLLAQNADLIAADPVLRRILAPALVKDGALDASMYSALLEALAQRPGPVVSVIADEVQAITFAHRDGMLAPHGSPEQVAARFFSPWVVWDSPTRVFVRMDIASSHGARELTLPSGEEKRLKVIRPWTADVVYAVTTNPKSPIAFAKADESARKRVVDAGGGIPRTLFRGKNGIATKLAAAELVGATLSPKDAVGAVVHEIKTDMDRNSTRWFNGLDAGQKVEAAEKLLPLLRGEVTWDPVKGLYDDGLVARVGETSHVVPVSPLAASVLMSNLGKFLRPHFKRLQDEPKADLRGILFEQQLITCLGSVGRCVLPTKTLSGDTIAVGLDVKVDRVDVFDKISDLEAAEDAWTLYVPRDPNYPCDIIGIPPASDTTSPIYMWEASITDPRDSTRVDDKLKWFQEQEGEKQLGVLRQLRGKYPARRIVGIFCYSGDLAAGTKHTKFVDLDTKAADCNAEMRVADAAGMRLVGVNL